MARDYIPEIRRLEAAYARVDVDAAKRKQKIAAKLVEVRRKAGLLA